MTEENNCKTSLIFTVKDRPGALYAILREFALRNINLTRLESRPAKKNLGDYLFTIDFAGGLHLPLVEEALREMASLTVTMKVNNSTTGTIQLGAHKWWAPHFFLFNFPLVRSRSRGCIHWPQGHIRLKSGRSI